jgi:formylglycine-generating enzyme required for sulfatase activity
LIVGDSGTLGDGTSHSTFDVGLYAARNIAPVGDGPPDSAVQTDAPRLGSLRVTVRQSFRLNGDSLQLRGVRADVILPSLTDHMKVGEAFLPQAVRFDRVEPIHHASFAMVTDDQKSRLQAFSDQRRRNSADFQRLADEIARLEARNGRKAISLQEAKAREELKPIGTFPGRKSNGQLFGPTFYNNEVLAVTTDYLRLQGRSTLQPAATAVPRRIHASWGWTNDPTAPAQTASDLTATAPSLRSTPSQTPSGGGTEPALLIAPFDPPQVRTIRDAWAQYQKTDVEWRNSLGMDLTLIPAGQFAMGSPDAANGEFPLHQVTISRPFYLGKYKVTKGQFKKFVEAIGYVTDTEADGGASWGYTADKRQPFQARPEFNWADWGVDQSDGSPVVNVSWNDAMAFCYWLSQKDGKTYRLPTEAEWEYACRAGTTTRFYNGENAEELTQIANVLDAAAKAQIPAVSEQLASSDGWAFTSPVGQFRPNNFGLYDMTGNAREWCADWYDKDYYATSPERDPAGPPSGFFRVSRGGGWNSPAALCSSARRGYGEPTARDFNLGFRVVQGGADVQTGWTIQNWEYQIHRHRRQIAVRHTEARAGRQQTTRAQQTPGQTGVIRQQAPASGGSSKGQIGRGGRRK